MQTTTTPVQGGTADSKADWRAALSPLIIGLGALLALQFLLALALDLGGRDLAPAGSQGPLLAFDAEKVTAIRVQDTEGEPVLVEKTESGWVIPSLENLPAAEHKVTELLSKLQGLQKGLPVATSEEALKRFKVSDQTFERKLTLERGDEPPVILYLGDSPGFRRLFVRADGGSAVYDVELGLFDAPDKADAWSDRTLLHLKTEDIQKLAIAGVTLARKDEGWQLSDLADGEKQDGEAIEDAVRQIANLDFLGVLAGDQEPEVDKAAAPVESEVTLKSGETIKYRITKLAKGNDYLLEVSNRPQRFTLAGYAAEDLVGLKKANLLKESEEAAATPAEEAPPAAPPGNEGAEPSAQAETPPPPQVSNVGEADAPEPAAPDSPGATPAPAASKQ